MVSGNYITIYLFLSLSLSLSLSLYIYIFHFFDLSTRNIRHLHYCVWFDEKYFPHLWVFVMTENIAQLKFFSDRPKNKGTCGRNWYTLSLSINHFPPHPKLINRPSTPHYQPPNCHSNILGLQPPWPLPKRFADHH